MRRDTLFAHLNAREREREKGKGKERGRDKEQEEAGKPSARRSNHKPEEGKDGVERRSE